MNSSLPMVLLAGQALGLAAARWCGPGRSGPCWPRSTRSVRSRSTGFLALWKLPQAQLPPAPRAFCQMISPRSSRPRSVLEDVDDVGRQRAVGLAAEVGHVDGDAAARLEHPGALGEHVV